MLSRTACTVIVSNSGDYLILAYDQFHNRLPNQDRRAASPDDAQNLADAMVAGFVSEDI